MEAAKGVTERDTKGVEPLVLSRPAIVIILVTAIAFAAIAFFLWGQADLDKWFLVSLNGLRTDELVVGAAKAASRYGMSVILLVYLVYLLFAFKNEKLRDAYRIFLLVFLMFGIAGVGGGDILKEIFNRPRPFVAYAGELTTFSDAATPAFPSGHAAKSMALALPFLLLITAKDNWHKGVKILLAFLVLAVCTSRVVLGAHYVSDVLAGVAVALLCFPPVTLLSNKILRNMTRQRLDAAIKIWAAILIGLMVYLAVQGSL